jgi:inosine/xanthosine triphosphate pyrophosphatase family protein
VGGSNRGGRETLEENALRRREGFAVTGLPALADDTGSSWTLGGPRVRSARYAGS